MGNGEWGMGNGERGMGNGERGMGNGERGMGNEEWGSLSSFLSLDRLGNHIKGSICVCWFHFQPFPEWWPSIAKLPIWLIMDDSADSAHFCA